MSFKTLEIAKEKLLKGDYDLASSYYARARSEGIANAVVDLRFLTKNYLVYPLEYEQASVYFELIKKVHALASNNEEYVQEYVLALESLLDIKRLFLRSLSLFYFSDIAVCASDSVVVREVAEIQRYIKVNKEDILDNDVYEIRKYFPKYNPKKFARDLNIIEAFCMNILLSYTAEQHSVYSGKRYDATTIDYGYFISTKVTAHDEYYNYANIKPRMYLLGYEAYYEDLLEVYKEKLKEIGNFDSPSVLKKSLTALINHKDKGDRSAKDFIKYAKLFAKNDYSRDSFFGTLAKLTPFAKLNPIYHIVNKNYIGSFELDEYFPRKKFLGVCSMLSAGQGWQIDTTRFIMLFACCMIVGVFAYFALAIAMRMGFYFGVNVEKH